MKLLLTSAGFINKSIANALLDLAGRPFKDLKLAFIPTAANIENGGKEWLIEDLHRCVELGFRQVDIVDISALPKSIFLPRLENSDVIFIGGGNTYHLMNWIIKTNSKQEFVSLLRTRIFIGLSAGSMIASKWWSCKYDTRFYDEPDGPEKYECLGFVDFHIMPHVSSSEFPKVTLNSIAELANEVQEPIYALDDNSAVKVDGDEITVISEGVWKRFN